jgi:fructokinase
MTASALGIGELLWDLLPGGERLGGAPFNVVAHLRRFGWNCTYTSAVGRDRLGRRALREAAQLGVDTSLIAVADPPTGVVRVRLDAGGTPEYEIVSPAAYETVAPAPGRVVAAGGRVDLLVFGTLAQRFPCVLAATRLLAAEAPAAVRLYDVNLRSGCWSPALVDDLLRLATIVKLNEQEETALAEALVIEDPSAEGFARAMARRYRLRGVCVTRGPDGASLLLDGVYAEARSPTVQVVDTVGAGDAFAAALGAGVVEGWSVAQILVVATRLGALVASRAGAIPGWEPSEIGLPASRAG